MPESIHVDVGLFQNGNAKILWTTDDIDLGATADGIQFNIDEHWTDQVADQTGNEPQDSWYQGAIVTGSFKLKHMTLQNLARVMSSSVADTASSLSGGGALAGASARATSYRLKIRPITHPTRLLTFHLAKLFVTGEWTFKSGEAVMVPVNFKVFPDYTKPRGQQGWKITE